MKVFSIELKNLRIPPTKKEAFETVCAIKERHQFKIVRSNPFGLDLCVNGSVGIEGEFGQPRMNGYQLLFFAQEYSALKVNLGLLPPEFMTHFKHGKFLATLIHQAREQGYSFDIRRICFGGNVYASENNMFDNMRFLMGLNLESKEPEPCFFELSLDTEGIIIV